MPKIVTDGISTAATRKSFDPVDAPDGHKLVLTANVDDDAVRQQEGGFNGMEKAFALVPRYFAGDVAWERKELTWQGALDGKSDTHRAWIDADSVDRQAIADRGVAFGLETNVGTLWLQKSSLNTPVTGEWADIAAGITPKPVEETKTDLFLGTEGHYFPGASSGVLAGKPLRLRYERYQNTFGVDEKITELTMHMRVNGGQIVSQAREVDRPWPYGSEFNVDVPDDARRVEVWFEAKGESGATYFDSQNGANFNFDVLPVPTSTIRFDEQWNEAQSAPLKAGESFQIAYDADRLHQFTGDGWYRMGPTFTAYANVSFDGKPPRQYPIARYTAEYDNNGSPKNFELTAFKPTVKIPDDAQDVRMWFRGYVMSHEHFDSNLGADYHFPVQP